MIGLGLAVFPGGILGLQKKGQGGALPREEVAPWARTLAISRWDIGAAVVAELKLFLDDFVVG
jgi:hypothetical protein